jgi:2'-5' RNA ligase
LRTLHDRIRSRLHGAGVAAERRRFRPHVTLARIAGRRDAAPILTHIASVRLGPFTCSQFALVRSQLHPEGAIHDPLAVYPLG